MQRGVTICFCPTQGERERESTALLSALIHHKLTEAKRKEFNQPDGHRAQIKFNAMFMIVADLDPCRTSSPSEQLTVWAIVAGMVGQGCRNQIISTCQNPDNPAPLKISPWFVAISPEMPFSPSVRPIACHGKSDL